MGTTFVAYDQYLDVSPTSLLVIGTVLVVLLIVALLSETAAAWIRNHRGGHR